MGIGIDDADAAAEANCFFVTLGFLFVVPAGFVCFILVFFLSSTTLLPLLLSVGLVLLVVLFAPAS